MTHLQIALDYTHATKINGRWRWYDDASRMTFETTDKEMMRLGAALQTGERDAYSRWCADSWNITQVVYAVVYGGESRSDYEISEGFASIEDARKAYSESKRIRYQDGLLGGASIVTLDLSGCPSSTIDVLAEDERLSDQSND